MHEIRHLLEHNHSFKYWKHMERVVVHYKECREWLRLNGAYLDLRVTLNG